MGQISFAKESPRELSNAYNCDNDAKYALEDLED